MGGRHAETSSMTSEEKKKKVAQTNKIVSKFGDPWKNFKSVYDKHKNHAT